MVSVFFNLYWLIFRTWRANRPRTCTIASLSDVCVGLPTSNQIWQFSYCINFYVAVDIWASCVVKVVKLPKKPQEVACNVWLQLMAAAAAAPAADDDDEGFDHSCKKRSRKNKKNVKRVKRRKKQTWQLCIKAFTKCWIKMLAIICSTSCIMPNFVSAVSLYFEL